MRYSARPLNVLLPSRVTIRIIPACALPYSASIPPVMTCNSSIALVFTPMNRLNPPRSLFTRRTPSIITAASGASPPLIVQLPSTDTPPCNSAKSDALRTIGNASISSEVTTYLVDVLSGSTRGRSATTTISAPSSAISSRRKSTVVVKSTIIFTSSCAMDW